MADRKASVALELKAGQFKTEAKIVEGNVRDVDREVEKLDRDITKIPADAARAAAAMKLLGGDVKDVGRNVEQIGDKSSALTLLDSRIKKSRAEVHDLVKEFEKTGDVDVFRRLGKSQGELSSLTNLRKKLASEIEDAGITAFDKIGSSIEEMLPKSVVTALSNPYIAAATGTVAVALGALIGAAIGGAITAAVAGGVVAVGIAGAVQADPKRIGAAWDAEITRIKKRWLDASHAFVDPTIKAIHLIGAETAKVPLDSMFAKASTFVEPLARGVAGFEHGLVAGVSALVDKAGPVIDVLSHELPEIGRAVEVAFTEIAGGSQGAADGLRDILKLVEGGIIGFGEFVRNAEDLWHFIHLAADEADRLGGSVAWDPDKPQAFAVSLDGAAHGMDDFASSAEQGIGAVADFKNGITDAAATVDTKWAGAIDAVVGNMLSLDNATLKWDETLTKLSASVDKNGATLNAHTKEGEKNRKVLLDGVEANLKLFDAEVASGTGAEEAGKHFQQHNDQLRAAAIAAGLNADAVDGMIKKYGKVPAEIQTQIEMHGLQQALANLDETLRIINHLPPRVTVDVSANVHGNLFAASAAISNIVGSGYVSSGLSKKKALGGIRHAAAGMMIPPRDPGTVLVGEPQTRGEMLIPLGGITQSRAMNLTQTVGDRYGFSVTTSRSSRAQAVAVTLDFSGSTDGMMATAIAKAARTGALQITARAIV